MKGGFSFCGVDIADIGLTYAPDLDDTYVYLPAQANIHEEVFESHHGGYFYGVNYQPKEFILRCFFEMEAIDKGVITRVTSLFRKGRSGRLVFQRMPWLYYNAVVTDAPLSPTNYMNGFFTITMKAYYPFARSDIFTCTRTDPDYLRIMANSAAFSEHAMELPFTYRYLSGGNNKILLSNPGTERAPIGIYIAGEMPAGVTIRNATTGQNCHFIGINRTDTTNNSYGFSSVYFDSLNGKTMLVTPVGNHMAFKYRHYGALELASCYPAERGVLISYRGYNTVHVAQIIEKDYTGQYIFVENRWIKIVGCDGKHTLILNEQVGAQGSKRTTIMPLNELQVEFDDPLNSIIDELTFTYKPTFA